MSDQEKPRKPGRPRSEAAKNAVLETTLRLMREMPVRDISIERIAKDAGVGRPTIYRGWGNKCAVVMDAFFSSAAPNIRFPKSSSVTDALCIHAERVIKLMRGPTGKIVSDMLGEGQSDTHILEEFRDRFFSQLLAPARAALEDGKKSGEISKDHDVDITLDLIYGPIYYRLVVGHLPLDERFTKALRNKVPIILGTA